MVGEESPRCEIMLGGKQWAQISESKYLGYVLSEKKTDDTVLEKGCEW